VAGLVIILGDPLADLTRRRADDGILCGIVVGSSPENFDPQHTLLDLIGSASQGLFHHVPEQGWIALTVNKVRARQ
jgi:hypothetical protein